MLLKNREKKLRKLLKTENLLTSMEECYCYAEDASNLKTVKKNPEYVVFVETIEDVQKVVKYANEHKIPIVARGAGTNMVGACVTDKGGIVLNFSKMNKILDFNSENMSITVQPGVVVGDIRHYVEERGLFYPPDPSNLKVSTIGGSIAQSSGGPMSFKYGTTKDYILKLTLVMADGSIMTVGASTIKNAVGYHLEQLIVGSEGTLAIVVEAELKLIPKPPMSHTVMAYFEDFNSAINCVNSVISSKIFPATIEFMDKNAINTVEKFYPSNLDTDSEAMLIIEVDGEESLLLNQETKISKIFNDFGAKNIEIATDAEAKERVWTARRSSYAATAKLAPDVISDDIIVPRKNLPEMIKLCREICEKYNLKVSIVGHVGDGNIHPQIALNLDNDDEYKNYMDAKSEIYDNVIKLNGTISAEHGIGLDKRKYLNWVVNNKAIEYMKSIKRIFDPNNILNPGKIFEL